MVYKRLNPVWGEGLTYALRSPRLRREGRGGKVNKSGILVLGAVLVFIVAVAATAVVMPDKGGSDLTGPYDLVAGWPDNPCGDGYTFGSAAGILADSPNRVLVFQRGCLPVLEDNRSNFGPQSLVPERNASGFDLSRDDPARHPREHNFHG